MFIIRPLTTCLVSFNTLLVEVNAGIGPLSLEHQLQSQFLLFDDMYN
jgi:hypothetical protein